MEAAAKSRCGTILFIEPPSADRQHICRICSKAFKRSEHRLRHERGHGREKPFPCRYCHKRYARKDLVARHEKTLHASKYTALRELNRNGPRNDFAQNSNSDRAIQNDTVVFEDDVESQNSAGLTDDDNPEIATPSHPGEEPTLVFSASLDSSASNQNLHLVLPSTTADPSRGEGKEPQLAIDGTQDSTPVDAYSGPSPVANDPHIVPSFAPQKDSCLQEEPHHQQQTANTSPSQNFAFTNLDFFDPYLGQAYDTSDLFNFKDRLEQTGTFSPLHQLGDIASPYTDHVNQPHITIGDVTLFNSQLSAPPISLETMMAQTQPQAQTLSQDARTGEELAVMSEPSPASTKATTSSVPEVVKMPQVRKTPFRITKEIRAALYSDLTKSLTQDDLWDFDFPETFVLEKCLRSYIDAFHVHLPIIHFPSLVIEETPSPLILIMCAIGALYRLERRLATRMYRKALQAFTRDMTSWLASNESLLVIGEFKAPADTISQPKSLPLWMMQARFLLAVFGTLNGNVGLIKRAFGLLGDLWIDCHLTISSLGVCEDAGESTWKDWTERESSKRIFYGMLVLSHMLSNAYGLGPAFSVAQLATLAMPDDQDLWDAPSEDQWLSLKRNTPRSTLLSLGEAVSKLMYDQTAKEFPDASWKWSPFATTVAIYAVSTQVWHISCARNLGIVPRANGIHTMFPSQGDITQTELALCRCRELLISAKTSGNPSWSDDEDPMLFNCMAVLRVTYGRSCMLTATLDRFILLRETQGEIHDAIKKYLSIDQPRGENITKAVARSVEGLFIPIQAGLLWTQKTAPLTWWVDHALAGWDTALFVTRWIHAIEQAQRRRSSVDQLERDTINEVYRLMREAQIPYTSANSLAAAVARYWATFFTDTWVWGVTPRIGFVLQQLSTAYEEFSAFDVRQS